MYLRFLFDRIVDKFAAPRICFLILKMKFVCVKTEPGPGCLKLVS